MSAGSEGTNTAQEYVPTFLERIGWKLFPHPMPEDADPENKFKDMIIVKTYWRPSIFDRLRLLVSGRLVVETRAATENVIGNHNAVSTVRVAPPSILSGHGK